MTDRTMMSFAVSDDRAEDSALKSLRQERLRQGLAELDAGQGIPLEAVIEWIESWDTPHERPKPVPVSWRDADHE